MSESLGVRRSADRFVTRNEWLESRHSFSFGPHYDPANVGFGALVVHNDDVVAPGAGFDLHAHRDMEIVTWVIEGELAHADKAGHSGVLKAGRAQRMSAGRGIVHSERNNSSARAVRFVQMWMTPDRHGVEPRYDDLDVSSLFSAGGWVTVASGMERDRDTSALHLHQRAAALQVCRLRAGEGIGLPQAAYVHCYVARGTVGCTGIGVLSEGDALRVTRPTAQAMVGISDAELLVWEMHGDDV